MVEMTMPAVDPEPPAAIRPKAQAAFQPRLAVRVWAGFLLAGSTLLMVGVTSFHSIQALLRQQQGVVRAHEAIDNLWSLVSAAQGTVLDERLYVMTGAYGYESQMSSDLGGFKTSLSQLKKLLADDPGDAPSLQPLARAIISLAAFATKVVEVRRHDGEAAAVAMIQTGAGISLLGEIHDRVRDLSVAEQVVLKQRSRATAATGFLTLKIIIFGSLFAIACTSYAGWYAWSSLLALRLSSEALARSHDQLDEINTELNRSNSDLEQFAYSASHDLQEPLRMVASYVELIRERYRDRLDADADESIDFAVDGASRMKRLINDLLHYSRTGRGAKPQPVEAGEALDWALANLALRLEETQATVTHGLLPAVQADPTQLGEVFQNLIENAVKFRAGRSPLIEINASRQERGWMFSVKDNGIGIDPQYHGRIFQMFQRLHGRNEYSGTGIGLAVCRKIVERHGGRIWVESAKDSGADFRFILPAANHAAAHPAMEASA